MSIVIRAKQVNVSYSYFVDRVNI